MPEFIVSSWIKKTVKEISSQITAIQVTSTIIFTFIIALFVIVLGLFVNDRIRKFLVSEDDYFQLLQLQPSAERSIHQFRELSDFVAPREAWHRMSDKELMWRASLVPRIKECPFNRTRKVAFMFLIRDILPLAPFWELFFKGQESLYSIYLHNSSDIAKEPPKSSVFYKRRIPSQPVKWGSATMVDAERRLLANALLDFSNERFILLSESCIPLFNFTTIYNYLINSNHSFVGSFDDPRNVGRGRYNKRMAPTILLSDWRKGNQWFEVQRELAVAIVSDTIFYPILRDHCKPPCYMDEHYLATLVTKVGTKLNSNRTITWVDWSKPGSHPARFMKKDVSEGFLNRIRGHSDCTPSNIAGLPCFLFARKFDPSTLENLLRLAPLVLGFHPKN